MIDNDTIAAVATPSGRGGVGIVRLSGVEALSIAEKITEKVLAPRTATFATFQENHLAIDEGVAIYFQNPQSFTGEDVVELQGHGGPVVMDRLLQACLSLGARLAKPGEFTERAFLNGKIDLTQAEAIADLIDASSTQAAQSALRSLQGVFSKAVNALLDALTQLRIRVEAAIDFPEEEIDFLADQTIQRDLNNLLSQCHSLFETAKKGALLRSGITVVIAGQPNAGKSSLLNALTGKDAAIVTPVAGTTRDMLREYLHLDGMPLHLIDTAGLRDSDDLIEQEGIKRAREAMATADMILWIYDGHLSPVLPKDLPELPILLVKNKIDLLAETPALYKENQITTIALSAKTGEGLHLLSDYLKTFMGYTSAESSPFTARQRHLQALSAVQNELQKAKDTFESTQAGELLAESLRVAQHHLGEITGKVTADDLLGKIFGEFCIGK